MELRKDYTYSIAVPTSIGVRITPVDRQPANVSRLYEMQSTSAETNVANIEAALGMRALVMTKFIKGSPISAFIKGELRARGFEYTGPEVEQGGPWGYRHQFNIADSGYGPRGPRVWNDRAGEVGRTLKFEDIDAEDIFGRQGVAILHMSGLFAAMSPQTGETCVALAKTAKKYGTRISFDINYRASFWKGREEELRSAFTEIAGLADVLVGNEEDFQLALGVKGPEAGGAGVASKTEGFKEMTERVATRFPNASVFATTLRQVNSANEHEWGAILRADGAWYIAEPRKIEVLDRIGGGDGFVGGLLYGILKGWESEKWVQFGWACGALAATLLTDYAAPADEDVIWDIYRGNARVKR